MTVNHRDEPLPTAGSATPTSTAGARDAGVHRGAARNGEAPAVAPDSRAPNPSAPSPSDRRALRDADAAVERILRRLREYRPQADQDLVRRAYAFAREAHSNSKPRLSGLPYITHPVAVTEMLAALEMDAATLAAGLLHDVLEDCHWISHADLAASFGAEVARLVEGVTKLKSPGDKTAAAGEAPQGTLSGPAAVRRTKHDEIGRNAATLRKYFVAMAQDVRVIVLKLADRLHNMRDLYFLERTDQQRIATETLQIYAPLAHRLGIWHFKSELDDLAFQYTEPEAYAEVKAQVARNADERQAEVAEAIRVLDRNLKHAGVEAHVTGRSKHLYSIYTKMKQQKLQFSELYDLTAVRVILAADNASDCYNVLGIVHALWRPIPGMFSDYIARSKSNLYQSLHTKVIGPNSRPLEVQIRTAAMHRTAEFGVAAHWQYKEGGKTSDQFERRLESLRQQMVQWQEGSHDPADFVTNVVNELFTDQVFVLTPKDDVLDLPAGSTPVDVAYRIHSDVGDHCVGARVNGRMVPLSYRLKNGEVVQVMTRPAGNPSRDWLGFVQTAHARLKIKAYFKRLHHGENVQRGRELLDKALTRLLEREAKVWGPDPRSLLKDERLRALAPQYNFHNENELLAAIGFGNVSTLSVLNRLRPPQPARPDIPSAARPAEERKIQIVVGGADAANVQFHRSRCCMPIPGDDVMGYVTVGHGYALHRADCPNAAHYFQTRPDRCTRVEYAGEESQVYDVHLLIDTVDRSGLLADVGSVCAEARANIKACHTQSFRDGTAGLEITVEVNDTRHLTDIMRSIRAMSDVLDIRRGSTGHNGGKAG